MKTSFPKPAKPVWYVVDASDKILGRLSTKIATVLRGRHKPSYTPHWICGDHVIVINAEKVKVTGKKLEQKTYYRHTGWLGHLRSATMKQLQDKNPAQILEFAVKGMMPKNQTRQQLMKRLHVFAGSAHDYEAQKPTPLPL